MLSSAKAAITSAARSAGRALAAGGGVLHHLEPEVLPQPPQPQLVGVREHLRQRRAGGQDGDAVAGTWASGG